MNPIITKLEYTYKKPDDDVWVLNTNDIPLESQRIKDTRIVHFAPQSKGGNHRHPRIEWFIGIGDLMFVWLDEHGHKHSEHMNPNEKLLLFEVPPFLPHAVVNKSDKEIGILFEYGDGMLVDKEEVEVT